MVAAVVVVVDGEGRTFRRGVAYEVAETRRCRPYDARTWARKDTLHSARRGSRQRPRSKAGRGWWEVGGGGAVRLPGASRTHVGTAPGIVVSGNGDSGVSVSQDRLTT